ncbi:hypothetical protein Dimus_001311, partial [Dionaea muscipula]
LVINFLSVFLCRISGMDPMDGPWSEPSGIRLKHGDNSINNSNNSNISSINSSFGDSGKVKAATGDLEADVDSLTCRQSGLSSADPMERNGLIQVVFY